MTGMGHYRKVLVVCPGNALTAGPEALHQLVGTLHRLGQPAAIVYHPFGQDFETPLPYRRHLAPTGRFADEPGTLIVFPEIFTRIALRVDRAEAAVWWMSVNNFTGERYGRVWRDRLRYFKYKLKGRVPWGGVKAVSGLRQFAQSDYARAFLESHGIRSLPLSDPIPVYTDAGYVAALEQRLAGATRRNLIVYNPSKGALVTSKLRSAYPQWAFQPLHGLDREQLAEVFLQARLYIDFGHHPGKDRLPREAALHGCCVITARHGCAANRVDVPIPDRFKLDVRDPNFVGMFGELVREVFTRFDNCSAEFQPYRQVIAQEPALFEQQVIEAFRLRG